MRMQVAMVGCAAGEDSYQPSESSAEERATAVAAMKGVGPLVDEIIAEGRRHG